jgi:hypothetical protein
VVGDGIRRLDAEINIVNTQLLIEPFDLFINQGLWDVAGLLQDVFDRVHLLELSCELRGDIANSGRAKSSVAIAVRQ